MNSTPEENAWKYQAFLLKWGGNKDTVKKVLEVLDVIDVPVNTDLVEDCHHIPS